MIGAATLLAWSALSVGLAVTPGADTALVATNAARGGVGAGLRAMAGIVCGGVIYALLFGFGVLRVIAAARGTAICVPTMTTSPAWRTIAPDDLSVGCVGFMGGASSLGLGLALARPDRRVIVLDGDGSLLMQLGSLATNAGAAPRNFVHLLFKNGVYHTSGAQGIPGGLSVDFVMMARGAGYLPSDPEISPILSRRTPQVTVPTALPASSSTGREICWITAPADASNWAGAI